MKYLTYLLFFFCFSVFAGNGATGPFTPPNEYEGGSPMPPDEIAGYNMFVDGVPDPLSPLSADATSFTTSTLPGGDHLIEIQTIATNGMVSSTNYEVAVTIPFLVPNPVTGDGSYNVITVP